MRDQDSNNRRRGLEEGWVEAVLERGRIEGAQVYLEFLQDRTVWNKVPHDFQDVAIQEVGRRLGHDFQWIETRLYQCQEEEHRIGSFEHKKTGAPLNLIPGGTFRMGDSSRYRSSPSFECKVGPLLIGQSMLSQAQWSRGLGGEATGDEKDWAKNNLSWEGSQYFLGRLNRLLECDAAFRLPTEAEWEYSCRAGTTTKFFWGDERDGSYFYFEENCHEMGAIEKHRAAEKWNAFGLTDMLGYYFEYCADRPTLNYEAQAAGIVDNDAFSLRRVGRGGAWDREADQCQSAFRMDFPATTKISVCGLRLCLDIPRL